MKNMLDLPSMISQCILLFWDGIEDKNPDKKKTMRQKDVEVVEEIVYKSVFFYLKRNAIWKCSLFLHDFFTNF